MLMLLLSLSALTQVGVQSMGERMLAERARQNALLGMQIALGQLQAYAGSDQRVTAAAESFFAAKDGARNWTGVWGNAAVATAEQGDPVLLSWLVSGNESAANVLDESASVFGKVLSSVATPAQSPVQGVPALGANHSVWDSLGSKEKPWGLLVGRGSVGADASAYVAVPLVEVGGQGGGRYGWWVGDEGIKTNIGLVDPIGDRSSATERSYSFMLAQRAGGEALLANYPVNNAALHKVAHGQEMAFAAGDAQGQAAMRRDLAGLYHDVTVVSSSVMTDALRGGLKKDLTAWLAYGGGPADSDVIIPGSGAQYMVPRWGMVRDYFSIRKNGNAVAARPQTSSTHGISPVVTYSRLGYGMSRTAGGKLALDLFPLVVLWNPTNVPITGEYELCFGMRTTTPNIQLQVASDASGTPATPARTARIYLNKAAFDGDPLAQDYRYFRFKIEETVIAPGESYVFALTDPSLPYVAGENVMSHGADPNNAAVMSSAVDIAAGEYVKWVLQSNMQSGNIDVLLRQAPEDPALADLVGAAAFNTVQPDALQTVQYIGHSGMALPSVPTEMPGFSRPFFQHYLQMAMTRGGSPYMRWLSQLNPRARQVHRLGFDGGKNMLYSSGLSVITTAHPPQFKDGKYASAGVNIDYLLTTPDEGTVTEPINLVVYGFQPEAMAPLSLAQLQHANLSQLVANPGYAVGNSIATPHIERSSTSRQATLGSGQIMLYDMSWHLNRVLWDQYFFSTVPQSLTNADLLSASYRLPNSRMQFAKRATKATDFKTSSAVDTNAGRLMLRGGFNVNSTSVPAWRALLAATNSLPYDPENPTNTDATALEYPFSRFVDPQGGRGGNWSANNAWGGHRTLSRAAIDALAEQIVEQVKERGPFLSVADFVNRSLKTGEGDTTGLSGALQSALNEVDAIEPGNTARPRINLRAPFSEKAYRSLTSSASSSMYGAEFLGDTLPYSSHAASAPGYLTQADLLTVIGPVLAARSDTFTIRSYGDVLSPDGSKVEARAWCEAIVQRLSEYCDPVENAEIWPPQKDINRKLGRRFQIISFRWLDADDV